MLFGLARLALLGGGRLGAALLSGLLRAGRQVPALVVAARLPARAPSLAPPSSVLVPSAAAAVAPAPFVV
ncbi:pyrroline-5-carboxylate reductase, partial [Mycobacterium tuberculosis]